METLLALSVFRMMRREFPASRELAERVLALAQPEQASAMLASGHSQLGCVLAISGQNEAAREQLERAIELFGSGPFHSPIETDFAETASGLLVNVLCVLGYPESALKRSRQMLAAARQRADPFYIARALFRDAYLHFRLLDVPTVLKRAEELGSIANEHAIASFLAIAATLRGWALTASGKEPAAFDEIRRAISAADLSAGVPLGNFLNVLAEACAISERPEEGLNAVETGLALAGHSGERGLEVPFHRLKGELLLMRDPRDTAAAERCFRTAIEVARRQKARFYGLRAMTCMARLLKREGKTDEARKMLSEIYNWFTEGFEFADLKDAKALLQELGA
jgi:adenylate cyclase